MRFSKGFKKNLPYKPTLGGLMLQRSMERILRPSVPLSRNFCCSAAD
jgi:hypothetical protein